MEPCASTARTCFGPGSSGRPVFDAFDGHGRLVRRRVFVDAATTALAPLRGWPDLSTVLAVETLRGVPGTGTVAADIRYFLTSCRDDPVVLVRAIRRHWSVENALHWVLDVTFREDDSRVRDQTATRNFALVRKIALNLIARDRSTQESLRGRRKKPPGTTTTCSSLSQTRLMREPWGSVPTARVSR